MSETKPKMSAEEMAIERECLRERQLLHVQGNIIGLRQGWELGFESGHAQGLKEREDEVERLRLAVIKYYEHSPIKDWACVECEPASHCLAEGFLCAYHKVLHKTSEAES